MNDLTCSLSLREKAGVRVPRTLMGVALAFAFNAAAAATLTLGVLQRANDERLAPERVAFAYPGQPGGPAAEAVDVAIKESQFELDAAKLRVVIEVRTARGAEDAKAQLQQLA